MVATPRREAERAAERLAERSVDASVPKIRKQMVDAGKKTQQEPVSHG